MTYNYSNFPQYREFSSVSTLAFFLLTSRIISPVNHFGWLAALTVELETAAKMERLVMRCDGTFRTIILLPHWLAVKLRGRWGGGGGVANQTFVLATRYHHIGAFFSPPLAGSAVKYRYLQYITTVLL